MSCLIPDLTNAIANMAVTFRSLAEDAERAAAARLSAREGVDPATIFGMPGLYPDPRESQEAAAYWRRYEKDAAEGFLRYETPPRGAQDPQTMTGYYRLYTAAIDAQRLRAPRPDAPAPVDARPLRAQWEQSARDAAAAREASLRVSTGRVDDADG